MKPWMAVLVGVGACGAGGPFRGDVCRLPSAPVVVAPPRERAPRTRNVVLVTIDGVRWQELFGGVDAARAHGLPCGDAAALTPNLHALGRLGVAVGNHGAPVVSSGPKFVSLPGYREIISGRADAACTDNDCGDIDRPTLLDELRAGQALQPGELAVIASWEKIARASALESRGVTVSAGRHAGAGRERLRVSARAAQLLDEGARGKARPGYGDYRPDRFTAPLAREYLRAERPRFLWVALGDTDEYAHRGDYAGYLDALRSADRTVGELWETLGELGRYGEETTLIVTADHGRADSFTDHGEAPESSRVWLVAAGGAVPRAGEREAAHTVHLADIAPTLRALLGLPADENRDAGTPIAELLEPAPAVIVSR
jgi:Metalloenzyme superfamily